jgi:hypothetical protein
MVIMGVATAHAKFGDLSPRRPLYQATLRPEMIENGHLQHNCSQFLNTVCDRILILIQHFPVLWLPLSQPESAAATEV